MSVDIGTAASVAGVAIAVVGGGYTFFSRLSGSVGAIDRRMVEVEVKLGVIWRVIEEDLPKVLHSPHDPEFDALLDKFRAKAITDAEAKRLLELTEAQIDGKRDASVVLYMLLKAGVEARLTIEGMRGTKRSQALRR